MINEILIGIDPGVTIGVCVYHDEDYIVGQEVYEVGDVIEIINDFSPNQVIMEDFIISPRPSLAKIPIEQIGVIKYICSKKGIPCTIQSPSAQTYGRLHVGKIISRSPHVISACSHVIYFLHRRKSHAAP